MSVAPYPEYKDSGVEWIGKIPAHWQFLPLKRAIDFTTGWTPPTGRDELYEGDNAWATIGDMSSRVIKETAKTISDEAIRLAGIKPSYRGSLLFSFKLSIGHVAFVERDLYTNEAIATFPANGEVELGFAYYAFPLFVTANAAENIYGAKLLNQELIRNAQLVLPPPEEQSVIAAFLDQETGKIDALVAEQERLIALLKEKRQAVISQAVTKGLNPNAPTKDSGIEWLGQVPAHWTVGPLKLLWSVTDCKHITADFVEEGVPLASIREVQGRNVDLTAAKQTTAEFYELLIEGGREPLAGDLIYSRNATVGQVAQVTDGHPRFALGQDVCLLRKHKAFLSTDFLQLSLQSSSVTNQLALLMVGSTFKRINIEQIRNFIIVMPPPPEQSLIASYLRSIENCCESLVLESTCAITLLRERRAALISAAVTGKIDVRALATSQPEAA